MDWMRDVASAPTISQKRRERPDLQRQGGAAHEPPCRQSGKILNAVPETSQERNGRSVVEWRIEAVSHWLPPAQPGKCRSPAPTTSQRRRERPFEATRWGVSHFAPPVQPGKFPPAVP